MAQLNEQLQRLQSAIRRIEELGGIFDITGRSERIAVLEEEMASQGFWDDREQARRVIAEANGLKAWVEPWRGLRAKAGELAELGELLGEDEDADLAREWGTEIGALGGAVDRLELRTMLQGEDDHREAMLTIHPGAGGLESQDWAEMLSRMYMRWAERRGFSLKVLDLQPAEEAGIKSVTLEIAGDHAYGYLRAEKGIHRLVRISPFDSQSRRHTSFASVFVYPVLDEEIAIEIDDGDLRIDTFRASGAGGQHVNKTDSAIRITHLPTGIVVSCQQERSQHKNRSTAMKMLRAALYQRATEEKERERQALESSKTEIGWGNQIRSYVFAPYTMVNDHRTETKTGNVGAVMDGALDPFIEAWLKKFGGARAG
ncbi:MAG: peptide chain release factor 2 [Gemmatimonadota bacterium]|nr:peptide chain release factor 2 [Gemmatimonadota bacterium]